MADTYPHADQRNDTNTVEVGGVDNERLRNVVERILRLEEERTHLASDIKDICTEAKSSGLDVKVIRRIVRESKKDQNKLAEEEAIYETYKRALGDFLDLPLGEAAIERAGRNGRRGGA
jgi:uncharacterized protein (UPF0335 family)